MKKIIKKAQTGIVKPTKDSTKYYNDENKFQWDLAKNASKFGLRGLAKEHAKKATQAGKDAFRQNFKGKPGFDANGFPIKKQKSGGKMTKAKDGKWIQKAINPKHKGYCTPMTKATCTPRRKALAMNIKKMGKARKGK